MTLLVTQVAGCGIDRDIACGIARDAARDAARGIACGTSRDGVLSGGDPEKTGELH